MNEFLRLEREAKIYKERYPKGTRIELISMNDSQAVPPSTRGTVDYVDDLGTIHMSWDNGRTLGICPQEDSFRKLTEQELEEEHMERRSRIVGKSTSLTTDSGYGCFEGYTTSNRWNGWQCPLFNEENADKRRTLRIKSSKALLSVSKAVTAVHILQQLTMKALHD